MAVGFESYGDNVIDITILGAESSESGGDFYKEIDGHLKNQSNPHKVNAAQVGLGNVPNLRTNDQTPTYTAAATMTGLSSGEKLSVAFGKIARAITELISHVGNKTNPHNVTPSEIGARADSWMPTIAEIGAAPSGFGYGESLIANSAETEAELETKLLEVINAMSNYTTMQARFLLGFTGVNSYFLATIFRHTSAYALVTLQTMRLNGATLYKVYSGGWLPIQWENPPMEFGVEYCTTERCEGKLVYCCRLNMGTMSTAGGTITTVLPNAGTVTEFTGVAISSSGSSNMFPFVDFSTGNINALLRKTGTGTIGVKSFSDCSNYTAYVTAKYTRG